MNYNSINLKKNVLSYFLISILSKSNYEMFILYTLKILQLYHFIYISILYIYKIMKRT